MGLLPPVEREVHGLCYALSADRFPGTIEFSSLTRAAWFNLPPPPADLEFRLLKIQLALSPRPCCSLLRCSGALVRGRRCFPTERAVSIIILLQLPPWIVATLWPFSWVLTSAGCCTIPLNHRLAPLDLLSLPSCFLFLSPRARSASTSFGQFPPTLAARPLLSAIKNLYALRELQDIPPSVIFTSFCRGDWCVSLPCGIGCQGSAQTFFLLVFFPRPRPGYRCSTLISTISSRTFL